MLVFSSTLKCYITAIVVCVYLNAFGERRGAARIWKFFVCLRTKSTCGFLLRNAHIGCLRVNPVWRCEYAVKVEFTFLKHSNTTMFVPDEPFSYSCIPLSLSFGGSSLRTRRLRRWSSAGSWVSAFSRHNSVTSLWGTRHTASNMRRSRNVHVFLFEE